MPCKTTKHTSECPRQLQTMSFTSWHAPFPNWACHAASSRLQTSFCGTNASFYHSPSVITTFHSEPSSKKWKPDSPFPAHHCGKFPPQVRGIYSLPRTVSFLVSGTTCPTLIIGILPFTWAQPAPSLRSHRHGPLMQSTHYPLGT